MHTRKAMGWGIELTQASSEDAKVGDNRNEKIPIRATQQQLQKCMYFLHYLIYRWQILLLSLQQASVAAYQERFDANLLAASLNSNVPCYETIHAANPERMLIVPALTNHRCCVKGGGRRGVERCCKGCPKWIAWLSITTQKS